MADNGSEGKISADDIAACCLSVYRSLPPKGAKPSVRSDGRREWTVLAGALLQTGDDLQCISLATGVKVLPYESLSKHGDLLHDSHAEVLARRCARTWLLKRLTTEESNEKMPSYNCRPIFMKIADQRWRLAADVKLHLYCSTFPCGDASNFLLPQAQQDQFEYAALNNHTTRRGRNGVSQDSTYCLRTKPGKIQSSPSISMSCTDKLCLWSVMGMQGSLLSIYIEPVYFDTIVIGADDAADVCNTASLGLVAKNCQSIFERKIGPSLTNHSKIQVCTLPFSDSRVNVQRTISTTRSEAKASNLPQELTLVPAAGSLVWIDGVKMESIIEGRRRGAALPRNKKEALSASTRSILSKRSYYTILKEFQLMLKVSNLEPKMTYYEAKHANQNEFLIQYRETKRRLRGSLSDEECHRLVSGFLSTTERHIPNDIETMSFDAMAEFGTNAPFRGWLVSGRDFEFFPCTVEN